MSLLIVDLLLGGFTAVYLSCQRVTKLSKVSSAGFNPTFEFVIQADKLMLLKNDGKLRFYRLFKRGEKLSVGVVILVFFNIQHADGAEGFSVRPIQRQPAIREHS